jgi:hypothetical protein
MGKNSRPYLKNNLKQKDWRSGSAALKFKPQYCKKKVK